MATSINCHSKATCLVDSFVNGNITTVLEEIEALSSIQAAAVVAYMLQQMTGYQKADLSVCLLRRAEAMGND